MPYCGDESEWVSNEIVYGQRYGKSYMAYYCRNDDAYVGCHNNTRMPLGTMANKELRQWRMTAYEHIDPLYKSGRMRRKTSTDAFKIGSAKRSISERRTSKCAEQ